MAIFTQYAVFDRDGFQAIIQLLYPYGDVIWAGDPRKFPGKRNGKPGEMLEMDLRRIRTQGTEDVNKTYDAATNALDITYTSDCIFTVNLRVESYSFSYPAYDRLREVCLLLRRQAVLDALNAIGLGYAYHHDIVSLPLIADERELFCAEADVVFNGLNEEQDDTATGGIISTIGGWSGPIGASGALPGTIFLPGSMTGVTV